MAKNYMEGNIDSSTYEDTCREMFGVHAYLTFTIDRLVQNLVRQVNTYIVQCIVIYGTVQYTCMLIKCHHVDYIL